MVDGSGATCTAIDLIANAIADESLQVHLVVGERPSSDRLGLEGFKTGQAVFALHDVGYVIGFGGDVARAGHVDGG